ncbi:unnamed protein product [Boreogadus saida]
MSAVGSREIREAVLSAFSQRLRSTQLQGRGQGALSPPRGVRGGVSTGSLANGENRQRPCRVRVLGPGADRPGPTRGVHSPRSTPDLQERGVDPGELRAVRAADVEPLRSSSGPAAGPPTPCSPDSVTPPCSVCPVGYTTLLRLSCYTTLDRLSRSVCPVGYTTLDRLSRSVCPVGYTTPVTPPCSVCPVGYTTLDRLSRSVCPVTPPEPVCPVGYTTLLRLSRSVCPVGYTTLLRLSRSVCPVTPPEPVCPVGYTTLLRLSRSVCPVGYTTLLRLIRSVCPEVLPPLQKDLPPLQKDLPPLQKDLPPLQKNRSFPVLRHIQYSHKHPGA